MPPSGFSRKAVVAACTLIRACYEDLDAEVASGRHASFKDAIEHEIKQLDSALSKAHINDKGELVER